MLQQFVQRMSDFFNARNKQMGWKEPGKRDWSPWSGQFKLRGDAWKVQRSGWLNQAQTLSLIISHACKTFATRITAAISSSFSFWFSAFRDGKTVGVGSANSLGDWESPASDAPARGSHCWAGLGWMGPNIHKDSNTTSLLSETRETLRAAELGSI